MPPALVRSLRDRVGLTRKQVAAYIGFSVRAVRSWEQSGRDHRRMSVRVHVTFCRYVEREAASLALTPFEDSARAA